MLALLGTVGCMIKAEWGFVHIELPEIARIDETIRAARSDLRDPDRLSVTISAELQNLLTGSYYDSASRTRGLYLYPRVHGPCKPTAARR